MSTPLDPIEAQADSYDRWFRERVQRSLNDPRTGLPHDKVIAELDALIDEIDTQYKRGT